MFKKSWFKSVSVVILAVFVALPSGAYAAEDKGPIKIGILHSLSGTMAISETSLRDVILMAIEEVNEKGGVLGRKLEAVVVDPASNWPLFAEKARELIQKHKVAVVFGCVAFNSIRERIGGVLTFRWANPRRRLGPSSIA